MQSAKVSSKQRILDAAIEIFSNQGFKAATVREICHRAEVGVASINYYFQGKEGLYQAVIEQQFADAIRQYPPDMGLGPDPTPEERLHSFIRSFLYRLILVARRGPMLVQEMVHPSPAFKRIHVRQVRPMQKMLTAIVKDLLGEGASLEYVERCCLSILGQCLHYVPDHNTILTLDIGITKPDEIDRLAELITRFSLGGIHTVRDKACTQGA